METYYLIQDKDINNFNWIGSKNFNKHDHIIIFTTNHEDDINTVNRINACNIKVLEVTSNDSSIDIHIASYVGYLLAGKHYKKCSIVILSKNKTFDSVCDFWKNKKGIQICRKEAR